MAEAQQETIPVPQQPVVIKPIRPAQTQSSFASCPVCGKYEPIGTLKCSQCGTSFVVTPPHNNVPQNTPHVPHSPGPIDWNHQGKVNSILIATTFHIFALFFIISAYFTSWFTRTPLYNLSIDYYLDHAEYSESITGYDDKIQYSQCDTMDGESCDDMKEYENISAPLWFASFIILAIIVIFGGIVIVPYQCYCCRDNQQLLCLSAKSRINHSLAFIFIGQIVVFCFTISAIAPFTTNFPYKKYCFYEEYQDDGIGCEWGSGTHLATTANAIVFGCCMFIFGAMIFLRDWNASPAPKSVAAPSDPSSNTNPQQAQVASDAKSNLLAEGIVNYNQPQQPQQPAPYGYQQPQQYQYMMPNYKEVNKGKSRTNWKVFAIWAVAAAMGVGYVVIINTSMIPNSDAHAMSWITNKWQNAQCFKPNVSESLANGYFDTPVGYTYSFEDVCSFTYPNQTTIVGSVFPPWYTCCNSTTCNSAFNYTHQLNYASTACRHEMSVITKGSCHPLAAEFTPKTNDIRVQSQGSNGVYICALYCKQIWNDCAGATFKGYDISTDFEDELDFCTSPDGLGVNVRSEVFTDQCLDDAYSIFNMYMFVLFLVFGALFV